MENELLAKMFNKAKTQIETEYPGARFTLVRATETHTAWRGETGHGDFIVVRNRKGQLRHTENYDWQSE